MTMHWAFHRKSNVGRLYLKRKDGGRGLISVEDCVRIEEENLLRYVNGSEEWMLQLVSQEGIVAGRIHDVEYRKRVEEQRKAELVGKPLHGRFFNSTDVNEQGDTIAGPRSWEWVRSGYMTKSTEAYLFAAQVQALRTNEVKAKIYREEDEDGEVVTALCRLCKAKTETVAHIIGCCPVLTGSAITRRHDKMGSRIHWELCKKYGVECSSRWYEHIPQAVSRDATGDIIIYWNQHIQTATPVYHNKPDVVVANAKAKLWTIIDFAVPLDHNIVLKEGEKLDNYAKLAQEVRKTYGVSTEIIPIVVGALGMIPTRLPEYVQKLGIPDVV